MTHHPQRVAVLGAGPSGLVTVKELLEEGHHPTCFDRAEALGGVFRFDEEGGVIWDSCRLTSSGLLTAFSDFPVPEDRVEHMTAAEYTDYLQAYARAFDLTPHLRFGMTVESVRPSAQGGWDVAIVDGAGDRRAERYDAVAICTGLHHTPTIPPYPGQDSYGGMVLHASRYRRPEQVAGRRVLVVGAGESGGDVAAEVSQSAAETVLSVRRGVAALPRWIHGHPNDYLTCRINNSAAHWIFQTRNPRDQGKRWIYASAFGPLVVLDKLVQMGSTLLYEWLPLLRPGRRDRDPRDSFSTRLATWRLTRRLLGSSGGTRDEQFGTKRDEFVRAIARGECRLAAPIERFDGDRVLFTAGDDFAPEVVIFCTGFEPRTPFLEEGTSRPPRFLHMMDPSIGPSLAFIGFLRPAYGAIPPLSELQARYFALLQSGSVELPSDSEMREAIERQEAFREHYFRPVRGRLAELVDYTSFSDDLAERIGCKPTTIALRREGPGFRLRFFAAPFVAAQYRLTGPHARPDIAKRVIEALPISHPPPMLALFYLRWTLSRLLHCVLGDEYAPKLTLTAAA